MPADLESHPDARRFRTVLTEGTVPEPNFAGCASVVIWGCGTSCQAFAIVDRETGRIYMADFALSVGAAFRRNSALFVAGPPEAWEEAYGDLASEALGGSAASHFYRWDGERLLLVDSLRIGAGLTAREAKGHLEVGVWSGELTPMHHPETPTRVQVAVSGPEESPTMEIRGPDGLVLPTHDLVVSESGVAFRFLEPEEKIPLRCDLRFGHDGVLSGRCEDPDGKWAGLAIRPPTGRIG